MTVLRHILVLLAEALAGAALLGVSVVWPPMHQPARSDVVVLLSGDGARLPGALRLMERRVASTLLFVGEPDTQPVMDVCRKPQPFEVICVRPTPDNTRTEAQSAGRVARDRHWQSMVLVSSRYHLIRARMLFRRCFSGVLDTVGDPPTYGPEFARRQVAHEWIAFAYQSVFTRGC